MDVVPEELITDMSLSELAAVTTPPHEKRWPPHFALTPNTAHNTIERLGQTVDELLEFREVEKLCACTCSEANTLLTDGQETIVTLRKENAALLEEVRSCKECLAQQKRDSELKIFRLQQDLEHRNLEIVGLRKDKAEFDFKMKLQESRHSRKLDELTQALQQARLIGSTESFAELSKSSQSDLMKLKAQIDSLTKTEAKMAEELEESRSLVGDLRERLQLQTARGDALSEAFADSLQAWKQVSDQVSQVLDHFTSMEHPAELSFPPIVDNPHFTQQLDAFKLEAFPSLVCAEEELSELPNELATPVTSAILHLSGWCKELISQWSLDLEENKMAAEMADNEMKQLVELCASYKSALLTEQVKSAVEDKVKTHEMETSMIGEPEKVEIGEDLRKQLTCLNEENTVLNDQIRVMAEAEVKHVSTLKQITEGLQAQMGSLVAEKEELSRALKSAREAVANSERFQSEMFETSESVKVLKAENEELSQALKSAHEALSETERLQVENDELSRALKSTRETVAEMERLQSGMVETTAEVVKGLKDELGDRVVNLMMDGVPDVCEDAVFSIVKNESQAFHTSGMTTYLSAADHSQPEQVLCVDQAYSVPREQQDALETFALEFAVYLMENQIFHPDDEPPQDSSVFAFLLDRYLLLMDTYQKTRLVLEQNLNELEEQQAATNVKTEALLSQISQLDVSGSTLCETDTSLTASHVDFDLDLRSSTLCEPDATMNADATINGTMNVDAITNGTMNVDMTMNGTLVADATHDPLELTSDPLMVTPCAIRGTRLSFRGPSPTPRATHLNGSRIPLGRANTPSASKLRPATTPSSARPRPVTTPKSAAPGAFREPLTTPLQRILRREACSTAKKSVTFKSPLLARTAVEAENTRLKTMLDEKLAKVVALERAMEMGSLATADVEGRVRDLETLAGEAQRTLESAETEFLEKREWLEQQVRDVTGRLTELTNKLLVEAINLDPALQTRLAAVSPIEVLSTLLKTIIARCQAAQYDERMKFEKEREEWASDLLQATTSCQSLREETRELASRVAELNAAILRHQQQTTSAEDKVSDLEEDVLRLVSDNKQLERDNAWLVKEYDRKLKAMDSKIAEHHNDVNSVEKIIEELHSKIKSLEEQMETVIAEKEELEKAAKACDEVESLKLMLDVTTTEKETMKQAMEHLTTKIQSVEEQMAHLVVEKSELEKASETSVDSLKLELEVTKSEKGVATEALKVVEESFASLESEKHTLMVQLQVVESTLALTEIAKTASEEETVSLQAKLTQVESEKMKMQSKLECLDAMLNQTTMEKVTLEESIAQLQQALEVSKTGRSELENKIASVEESLSLMESEKGALEQHVTTMLTLQATVKALEAEKNELNVKLGSLEVAIGSAGSETQASELVTKLEALMITVESMEIEKRELTIQLAALEGTIAQLEAVVTRGETEKIRLAEEKDELLKAAEIEKNELAAKLEIVEVEKGVLEQEIAAIGASVDQVNQTMLVNVSGDVVAKINGIGEAVAVLKSEAAVLQETLRAKSMELGRVGEQVRKAEGVSAELEQVMAEKVRLLSEAQMKLQVVSQEKSQLEENMNKLEVEKAQLVKSIQALEMQLQENKEIVKETEEKESELETKESELLKVMTENQQLVEDKLQTAALLTQQQQLVQTATDQIEALKQQHSKLEQDLKTMLKEKDDKVEQMQSFIAVLEVEAAKQTEAALVVEELKQEVANLKDELSRLQVAEEKRSTELQQLQTDKSHVVSAAASYEQKYNASEAKLALAVATNKEFEDELMALKDELIANKTVIERLKIELNDLITEKTSLTSKLEEVTLSRETSASEQQEQFSKFKTEQENLNSKLESLTQSRDAFKSEKEALALTLGELTKSLDAFKAEQEVLNAQLVEMNGMATRLDEARSEKEELLTRLEVADAHSLHLAQLVEEYKSTEAAILRKLEAKQTSDETAIRLTAHLAQAETELARLKMTSESSIQELSDQVQVLMSNLKQKEESEKASELSREQVRELEQTIRNLVEDRNSLSSDLEKNSLELNEKEQSLAELARLSKDLEKKVWQKEEESLQANDLLKQRADVISGLNVANEKLSADNDELRDLLVEIQKVLGLPEEAGRNMSADSSTRSYLRLVRENVGRTEGEIEDLRKQNLAMLSEQQRLSIEVERLTADKVHFEIKAAELDAFGRSQEEQIHALSNKLNRLEAGQSRRSRRSDPIGPRRLEKLEELNKTLHELLTQLLATLQMPSASKLRLISQREVEGASRQILDHAAKLAAAHASLDNLKEQMKTLDQENQELSDNMETLLKDNSKLELQILELQNAPTSTSCSACNDLRKTLKQKTEALAKMEADAKEMQQKINELDQENDDLSDNVEALLKDNSKLEMQLLDYQNNTQLLKDCTSCVNLKKAVSTREDKIAEVKAQCETLQELLTDKEQQLFRALNSQARGDDARTRPRGVDADESDKMRSLTRDNAMLKELLRKRGQTIRKLEAAASAPRGVDDLVMNSNSLNSPIRERNYNLRTRTDVAAAYKRVLRPKVDGVENLRI